MIDFGPPLLVFPKPAIIRQATADLLRYGIDPVLGMAVLGHKLRRAAGNAGVADITIVDDGDAAPSSGTGTATHTYDSQTSTGPHTAVIITWQDFSDLTLSSLTWNGDAMSILVQGTTNDGQGAAIAIIDGGARSGNLVAVFNAACDDSQITKVSLANLQSMTPVDTDLEADITVGGTADLDSLSSPGVGGIRIAGFANRTETTAVTWSNATELSDLNAGAWRHSAGYDLGDDSAAIAANGDAETEVIVGVSLR